MRIPSHRRVAAVTQTRMRYQIEPLEDRVLLANFVVVNTNDGGGGSLRSAMDLANRTPGPDSITFNISGTGVQTIAPATALPELTDAVAIDGTTQPGYAPWHPVIDLDGRLMPFGDGIRSNVGNIAVKGLVIHSFPWNGILLHEDGKSNPTGGSVIQGNFIGTDPTGTVEKPNLFHGIHLVDSPGNTIGGTLPGQGNVISGNNLNGIALSNALTANNHILGNLIGTDVTGNAPLPNAEGIFLSRSLPDGVGYASDNFIGHPRTGDGNVLESGGNIIAGNVRRGLTVFKGSGNKVQNNYIGVGLDGVTPLPNGTDESNDPTLRKSGVTIEDGSNNEVGGVQAGAGNLISANRGPGVQVIALAVGAGNNLVRGNLIGTDWQGNFGAGLGNFESGVDVRNESDSDGVTVSGTVIGGADADDGAVDGEVLARNVISGNSFNGVNIVGHRILGSTVRGNYIGTDADGLNAVRNGADGVHVSTFASQGAGSTTAVIGGQEPGAGNVISANAQDGIFVGFGASAVVVANVVGLNKDSAGALGNGRNGVLILDSSDNVIGTTVVLEGGAHEGFGNLISANGNDGVQIAGQSRRNNVFANFIGTAAEGAGVIGNGRHGVALLDDARNNDIGGAIAVGNIIVGSGAFGVLIFGPGASNNRVRNNSIGIPRGEGMSGANGLDGLAIINSPDNIVGGTEVAGETLIGGGNVISGNLRSGIRIEGPLAARNQVTRNRIGIDDSDGSALGNEWFGIHVIDAPDTLIGGAGLAFGGNVISANGRSGVALQGPLTVRTQLIGNFIGADRPDDADLGNGGHGVLIDNAPGNFIGGTTVLDGEEVNAGNVIASNGQSGIGIEGPLASANQVLSNAILGNMQSGVDISGGPSATVVDDNVISGNALAGVKVTDSPGTILTNNLIGTTEDGLEADANANFGVWIISSPGTIVGGASFEDGGNLISGNDEMGVVLTGTGTIGTRITGNYIGTDFTGAEPLGNAEGVAIGGSPERGAASRTLVSNNVVAGNLKNGVLISRGAFENRIENNFIGTNSNADELPNGGNGVAIDDAPGNTVGGIGNNSDNLILWNVLSGVSVKGVQATGNSVLGNGIGRSGLHAIEIRDGAPGNLIDGNLLTRNRQAGVFLEDAGAANMLTNNTIGTNREGTEAQPNGAFGVWIKNTPGTVIGGASFENGGNLISGNELMGIVMTGSQSIGTLITGNYIGTDITGNGPLANDEGIALGGSSELGSASKTVIRGNVIAFNRKEGVLVALGAFDNTVGGNTPDLANRISNNGRAGVAVTSDASVGNAILVNRIFANAGLGIDLGADGVTLNDQVNDSDSGPNNLQNFPALRFATVGAGRRIAGTLSAAPGTVHVIRFFTATNPDSSGFGEGDRYLTSIGVTTNASGIALFDTFLPEGVAAGTYLTATATSASGNTSEFSKSIRIEVDADGDGVPDRLENGGANSGDANQDGVKDGLQNTVATFPSDATGEPISVELGSRLLGFPAPAGAVLTGVRPLPNPSPDDAPASVGFGLGFYDFTVTGLTPGAGLLMQVTLPIDKIPMSFYRYGPTSDQRAPHWYDWSYDGNTGVQIFANTLVLHFIDGQRGDDDLVANGTVVDPGGPAFPQMVFVTNTFDSGPGSLRQAILDANERPGLDLIAFNIGSGVRTITPLSNLPAITDTVLLDGTTQPGFAGSPIIEIAGNLIGSSGIGLIVRGSNTIVRGLVINRFGTIGIVVPLGDNVVIQGNYIGTDVTGLQARPNGDGVSLGGGANHLVGGTTPAARNVISGNSRYGIFLEGSGHRVQGNLIGVGADGATPLGNGASGVSVNAPDTQIGGLQEGASNVIAFNKQFGIVRDFNSTAALLSNRIYENRMLGIAGPSGGLHLNESFGAGDGGMLNYPVLTSASLDAGSITISGYLRTKPNETFLLQFFSSRLVNTFGFGEGETLLGSTSVSTGRDGIGSFAATFSADVPAGRLITATSTEAQGRTSLFSRRLAAGDVLGSVYTVNSTDDVDDGVADATHTSLREAIHATNNHPGPDVIRFSIGSGVKTIAPRTTLPLILEPVVIDGTTQPGYAGAPIIELTGSNIDRSHPSYFRTGTPVSLTAYTDAMTGIGIVANNTTVRGLVINRFYETGFDPNGGMPLWAIGNGNVFERNYVGTDVAGAVALRNLHGLFLQPYGAPGSGQRNVVSGNLTSGNVFNGIEVRGTATITGNRVGTDATGTRAVPNGIGNPVFPYGIGLLSGSDHIVGGEAPGAGNLISGNAGPGLFLMGSAAVVQGNVIGADVTGTRDLGNNLDGIWINDAPEGTIQIGGTSAAAGNILSGNDRHGIYLQTAPPALSLRIQGNRIGVQADGVSPLGNGGDGVRHGIQGAGIVTLGERLIGGLDSSTANTVAFNGGNGVNLLAGRRVGILSNSIFSNAQLGIDLNGDGVTSNDSGDADAGDNDLQNYPVLTAAATDGVRTSVTGSLNGTPNIQFVLQFFANSASEPSGFGEGRTLLATWTVSTDAMGNASFTVIVPAAVAVGQFVSATATDPANNTSEFARSVQVPAGTVGPNQPPSSNAGGPYVIGEGSTLNLSAVLSFDGDGDPLIYSWDVNGDGTFGDATGVTPTLPWAQLEALGITDGPGSFTVRVIVDDGQGHATTSAPADVTVLNVAPVVDAGPDRLVIEGDRVSLTGTFTDPGPLDSHTVSWSVVADNGQQIAGGSGPTFEFHTVDNGNYAVTFTVTDNDGGVGSQTVNILAVSAPPRGPIAGLPERGVVGMPIHLSVSPTDPSPADTAAGFTYEWNVYLNDNPVAEGSGREFSFTPGDTGTYTIDLRMSDKDFATSFSTTELVVETNGPVHVGPVVTLAPTAFLDEGGAYAAAGSFADPDPGDAWTATVDYGDGTTLQPVGLRPDKSFDLGHAYVEDGVYEVVVRVTDSAGLVGTGTAHVTVRNVAPAVMLDAPSPVAVGAVLTLSGSFADPGADVWSGTVNYGDGTGDLPLALGAGGAFTLGHTYDAAGEFTVTVIVSDDDGGTGVATRTAIIEKVSTSLAPAPTAGTYGGAATVAATLTSGGVALAGRIITFEFAGVAVGSAVTDSTGRAELANVSLAAFDAGPVAVGVTFAGDDRHAAADGASTLTVAKARLVVVADDKARVYGQENPALTGSVAGVTHGDAISATYATDAINTSRVGVYPVVAVMHDPDGRLRNYDVTVEEGILAVMATTLTAVGTNLAVTASVPFSGVVASFTTDNPIAATTDFTVTINWGNGSSSAGTVRVAASGGFEVVGQTTYAAGGTYAITVGLHDDAGGGSATAGSSALVSGAANAAPVVTITTPANGAAYAVGAAVSLEGSFVDSDVGDTHTAFWTVVAAGQEPITVPGTVSGDGRVTGTYAFPAAGVYQVTLTVTDSRGASGSHATGGDAGVVVYDAAAGKVSGGGWFRSPAGASSNPAYAGLANLGFNAQYKAGEAVPTGQFQFRVGRLIFHSSAFESLVVRNGRARLAGFGTINGRGGYSFRLTFVDGRRVGGPDRVRVRIWATGSGAVVYDSGGGAGGDGDDTLTPLSGGNTTIFD